MLGGIAAAGVARSVPVSAAPNQRRNRTDQATDGPLADPETFESFLDGVMEAQLEAHDVAGATVSVVDGEATFAKGYGYSDVGARKPVDADETLFRVGSVSKLVAWTAVMQAIERGDLDPQVDVNRYLDDVEISDTYEDPITLEHLATHTAGFEDRARGTFVTGPEGLQPLETVLSEERPARVRPPGEFTAYSNYGTGLAAHLAAEAAGSAFDVVADESIFSPLGMDRSTFAQPVPGDLQADLSKGYVPDDDTFRESDFEYVGIPPVGSMSATATDVAKFMHAYLQDGATDAGRILEPESVAAMHRQRFTNDDRLNGMCFGFYEMSRNGVRAVGHGGDTDLFHALVLLIPEDDVGLFVSYNSPGGVAARQDFTDAFFDRYYPADEGTPVVPDERTARDPDIEGTYRSIRMPYTTSEKILGATDSVSVSIDDRGRLVTSPLGGETRRWVETDPLYFEEVGGPDALAFREVDGEITHLFFDSRPPSAYSRIASWERPLVHGVALAVSLLVFLSALVGWPAAAVWRRHRGRTLPGTEPPARFGRWIGGATVLSFVTFVAIFLGYLVTNPEGLLLGDPLPFQLLLVLPAVGTLLTVGAVAIAALAWHNGYWSRWNRIHYSIVVLAAVAVTLILGYWNLLWYQM